MKRRKVVTLFDGGALLVAGGLIGAWIASIGGCLATTGGVGALGGLGQPVCPANVQVSQEQYQDVPGHQQQTTLYECQE